ncbi:MAG: hypothetical protein ACOC3J_02830 [Gemmatimonadota bacterium]
MNWIRPVYLYLFSLLGLVLITIGSVQLVGLALRTYVLTDADAEVRIRYGPEPPAAVARERIEGLEGDTTLAPATREARESLDPVRSRRQREAAGAIALLVVGLPLYIYHWRTIRRERTPVA